MIFPDLTSYGYQITKELGANREGGRITWQALALKSQELVVIKQFCFASTNSSWSGYKAYEREIELLQQLNHPGIPRYLGSIETDNGFCLIQEYKPALSLTEKKDFKLEEVKIIIIKILEILVYLQKQTPPIFHRDIKPENILIDAELNTYLVDFGFASLGNKEVTASSVFKGTPGFIPPEQIIQPTKASDLYSLGVTIICLLTGKKSPNISALATIDNPYLLNFKPLLPQLNPKFINWLGKMVQPQASKRFSDAATAKTALQSIDILPTPNIDIASKIQLSLKQIDIDFVGSFALSFLSAMVIFTFNLVSSRVEHTLSNLAIALVGVIVVAIAEVSAVIFTTGETQLRIESTILAIGTPIVVVVGAIILLGWDGAMIMAAAITCAEAATLAYVLKNQFLLQGLSNSRMSLNLLLTVAIGLGIGAVSLLIF
jgi:serine/threonine protein kinase